MTELTAGPELDAAVAAALGCQLVEDGDGKPACGCQGKDHEEFEWRHWPANIKTYSTDLRYAWSLVERFGLIVGPTYQAHPQAPRWRACVGWQEPQKVDASGMTAPEAICRAVLLAATLS